MDVTVFDDWGDEEKKIGLAEYISDFFEEDYCMGGGAVERAQRQTERVSAAFGRLVETLLDHNVIKKSNVARIIGESSCNFEFVDE